MDSWKEMDIVDFTRETVRSRWEYYYDLGEETRALMTFRQYLSLKYPRWRKDEITFQVKQIEEYIAWEEARRNPTPIRSTQLCYSCKVPWEPDHRCRGKGKKHIIEVHYDSDDEDLEQSDDDSDPCTEASDSDSTSEDSDDGMMALAQRLVIVTLPQRIVRMTLAQRLAMLARLRRMMTLV
jgi:hypothetical protein